MLATMWIHLPHTMGWVPHLPICVFNTLHHLKKSKIAIHHTTLHDSNQILSMFSAFWPIADMELYGIFWGVVYWKLPDLQYLLRLGRMDLNSLTEEILLVFETNFHSQSVILIIGPSSLGYFFTAVLMPFFVPANSTLFLVDLLDSLLWCT